MLFQFWYNALYVSLQQWGNTTYDSTADLHDWMEQEELYAQMDGTEYQILILE